MKRRGEKCWFSYTKEHVGVVVACSQCSAWYVRDDMEPDTYPHVVCANCYNKLEQEELAQMRPVAVIKYSKEDGVVVTNVSADTPLEKPDWDK